MVYDSSKDWVAFEQESARFDTIMRSHGDGVRRKSNTPEKKGGTGTEAWMKQPINGDASWKPVPAPESSSRTRSDMSQSSNSLHRTGRPPSVVSIKGNNATNTNGSTAAPPPPPPVPLTSAQRQQRQQRRNPNPASSDSSSSSAGGAAGGRGGGSASGGGGNGVAGGEHSRRTREINTNQPQPVMTAIPPSSERGRSNSSRSIGCLTPTSRRGRSSSRSRQNQPSPSRGRGRSSSLTKDGNSRTQSSPIANRGRSKSRPRAAASATATTTSQRSRSNSRTPTNQKSRSRSVNSRNARKQGRSRSTSRNPSDRTKRPRSTSRSSRTPVTRQDSATNRSAAATTASSRNRSGPPPSTSRTRREMRGSNSVGPGLPRRRASSNDDASVHTMDANIGRDISFGMAGVPPSPSSTAKTFSSKKRSQFMEKLFGNQVDRSSVSEANTSLGRKIENIHPRILLTATVYHNMATNLWITTINTNQRGVAKNPNTASKYLKAFSFASEREARESAIANAPPKMIPFAESPNCFICEGKFAVFRRAGHCRNCGVCVCNGCSTHWPSKMIPETYNLKKESTVKICRSCDCLSRAFKKSLTSGNYEDAVALYGTGNINLRTPCPASSKKDEVMHPIHCAVEGGNVNIVRWLMDDHFCPVKLIRTGSGKKPRRNGGSDVPILTSKGRSVLNIAIDGLKIDILRYLVVECDVEVHEAKDLKSVLRALEAALLALPAPQDCHVPHREVPVPRWDDQSFSGGEDGSITGSSLGLDEEDGDASQDVFTVKSKSSRKSHSRNGEACIICYDNPIDCVMTPCGHQVCCLECSANLSACPVCNIRGEFIKIFRP